MAYYRSPELDLSTRAGLNHYTYAPLFKKQTLGSNLPPSCDGPVILL
jgi:hypothetical protein